MAPAGGAAQSFDLTKVELLDALLPPAWQANGQPTYLLGTDSQGRDLYSAILYGTRVSLLIGLAAVALSMVIGIVLGLVSGYAGGRIDAFIMRVADVQLSFPAILIALLIDGVARAAVPRELHEVIAFRCWSARSRLPAGRSTPARCAAPPWWRRTANTCRPRA